MWIRSLALDQNRTYDVVSQVAAEMPAPCGFHRSFFLHTPLLSGGVKWITDEKLESNNPADQGTVSSAFQIMRATRTGSNTGLDERVA